METVFDRGVYLPELDLWLDSLRRREFGVISHAHSDHIARHSRPVLTRNTGLLLADYLKKSSPITLDYHEPFDLDGYTITLYPAGHCLGSAQALVTSKESGTRLLYTGDLKTRTSPTNEPLEPVSCDVLVLEATYGQPEYNFPPQEQVLSSVYQILRSWISRGEKPVVQLWRLGKSQEVLHLLLGEGFDVVMDQRVYEVARIYEQGGVSFPGSLRPFYGHWAEGQVLICPPGKTGRAMLSGVRGLRYMELTGWAAGNHRWGSRADVSLPYSDHAGFDELVEYVGQVKPRHVYTVNGFPGLAARLRDLGYPAVHLNGKRDGTGLGFQMKLL